MATDSPGLTRKDTSFKTQFSSLYANHTLRNSISPRARRGGLRAFSGFTTVAGGSTKRKNPSGTALFDSPRFDFLPLFLIGLKKMPRDLIKSKRRPKTYRAVIHISRP